MAQVDFFLCKEEKIELADLIFSKGLIMIPDLAYDLERPAIISNSEQFKDHVDCNDLMFITDLKADISSFVFSSFEKDGEKKLYIRQRYGVPTIDFYFPGMIEKTENKIGPGFISNYPFYYNKGGDKIYPSEEDKILFKNLSSFIKKRAKSVKLTKRTYWIGNRCIDLCKQQGYELIRIGDKNLIDML